MSAPLQLYNQAYQYYERRSLTRAIELLRQGLASNPRPGEEMILKYQLAVTIWADAGLEVEGRLESLNADTAPAAEEAMHLWEDVVNTYHQKVKGNPEENRKWALPGASPYE